MIEIDAAREALTSICLRVLEELGFNHTDNRRYSLETVVEAVGEIVECLDGDVISALVVAGGTPTAEVYATPAWTEWFPGTAGHRAAALAVIAHLGEMIA